MTDDQDQASTEASKDAPGEASKKDPGEASQNDLGEASKKDPGDASQKDPGETSGGAADENRALSQAPEGLPAVERLDEDGLPLDREPTLDDVRSNAGSGRVIAVGCTVLVVLVLGLFWLIRGGLL